MFLDRRPSDGDDSLKRRVRVFLSPRPRRYTMLLVVLLSVFYLTRDAATLPFVVGYTDSAALLQKEARLAELKAETSEYRKASRFFGKPEGKQLARRVMYNYLDDGERQVIPEPEAGKRRRSATEQIGHWIESREQALAGWGRRQVDIVKRWAVDPPKKEEDYEALAPPKGLEDMAQEAFDKNAESEAKPETGGDKTNGASDN